VVPRAASNLRVERRRWKERFSASMSILAGGNVVGKSWTWMVGDMVVIVNYDDEKKDDETSFKQEVTPVTVSSTGWMDVLVVQGDSRKRAVKS
jgi:hypothetical protein